MDDMPNQFQFLTNLWIETAQKMMSAGLAANPSAPVNESARKARSDVFQAWAEYWEQFMRTPMFLQGMRQTLNAQLEMRKQMDEMFTRAHHATQSVARQDIDDALRSVRHLENRLLSRLDDIVERLESVSDRLETLEASAAPNNGKEKPAVTPRVRARQSDIEEEEED